MIETFKMRFTMVRYTFPCHFGSSACNNEVLGWFVRSFNGPVTVQNSVKIYFLFQFSV